VRPMFVVPFGKQQQLFAEMVAPQRNQQPARASILERLDEPLDNGDAAMPADCTEPQTEATAARPVHESHAQELRSLVADQVLWLSARLTDGACQERANDRGGWLIGKRCHSHHALREMVDDGRSAGQSGRWGRRQSVVAPFDQLSGRGNRTQPSERL